MLYVTNLFSLHMLPVWRRRENTDKDRVVSTLRIEPIPSDMVHSVLNDLTEEHGHPPVVCIATQALRRVACSELGLEDHGVRATIQMNDDTTLLVAQFVGRVPDDAITKPLGVDIEWFLMRLDEGCDDWVHTGEYVLT